MFIIIFFQKFVIAKCRYAEDHYRYRNTELNYDVYPYAECFYAERQYAECVFAKYRYSDCHF